MCTYLAKRGATYYFRRPIPEKLRPFLENRTQFMQSLGTKDREEAKQFIPDFMKASDAALNAARAKQAGRSVDVPSRPTIIPPSIREMEEMAAEADAIREQEKEAQRVRRDGRRHLTELLGRRMELSTEQLEPWEAAIKDLIEDARANPAEVKASLAHYEERISAAEAERRAPKVEPVLVSSIVDKWGAERQVQQKGIDAHKAVARWFEERVGKVSMPEITRQHVLQFKDKLAEEGQSPQNINVKLSRLRTLFGWAMSNDHMQSNPADGISIKGKGAAPKKRLPFDLADLRVIFGSPVFTEGLRPEQGRGEAAYWLPLLALYTGARMEELGQLRPTDLQKLEYPDLDGNDQSSWFLRITTLAEEGEEATKLKNEESERLVPVHPELERLGFIRYALAIKKAGHPRIFPLLKPGAYDRLTAKWGEWFSRYRRDVCKITDKRKVFHSFRHTFKDQARHVGMPEGAQRQIMGHSGEDTADDYGEGHSHYRVTEAMKTYRVIGLHLPGPPSLPPQN